MKPQAASFDVFDTVLTRLVGKPEGVFLLLGRRLFQRNQLPCSAEAFARARVDAEVRARDNADGAPPTLEQIYREVEHALGLSAADRSLFYRTECELESELIRPVPGAAERVASARAEVGRVLFVSDMYLPEALIRRQLRGHGFLKDGDGLYLSACYGVTKSRGALFGAASEMERIPPGAIVHLGNHRELDVSCATAAGFSARLFPQGNLDRYEEMLERWSRATEGLTSVMAGASRLARLSTPVRSRHDEALRDVATGVIAPTIIGYVLWILRQSQRLGIRRLYFVSRDGQIVLKTAERLQKALHTHVELRYLYGSRQAWHLPAVTERVDDEQLRWILAPGDAFSVRCVLARVELSPEEVEGPLVSVGLPRATWDRKLSRRDAAVVGDLLVTPPVEALVRERAAGRRELALRYLVQEGLCDDVPWGLVDIGWHGRMCRSLCAILRPVKGRPAAAFYFGLYTDSRFENAPAMYTYFFNRPRRCGQPFALTKPWTLMETLCCGDHGPVFRYEEKAAKVVPVIGGAHGDLLQDWGVNLVHNAVCRVAETLVLSSDLVNVWADVRAPTMSLLEAFWHRPTRREAEAWGAFPFESEQAGGSVSALRVHYSLRHVVARAVSGQPLPSSACTWPAGSLACSSIGVRAAVYGSRLLKGTIKGLRACGGRLAAARPTGRRLLRAVHGFLGFVSGTG